MVLRSVRAVLLVYLLFPAAVSFELLQTPDLQQVENSLLSALGMDTRPRPTRNNIHIPEYMMELYRQQTRRKRHSVHFNVSNKHTANTVRSYTHIGAPVDEKYSHNKFHLRFDTANIPLSETLQVAELKLKRQKLDVKNGVKQRVLVYEVIKPAKKNQTAILRLLDSQTVDVRDSGVLDCDVTPAVQRWLQNHKHNYGLFVKVVPLQRNGHPHEHVRLRRDVQKHSEQEWWKEQPVLLAFSDDGKSRPKRTPHHGRRRRKGRRDNCRRHKLYVDFQDVGWNDWIVAPPGYDAFYCQGKCPFPLPHHFNTTNHAIVQTLVNSYRVNSVPPACCVPTDLSSISILFLDAYEKVVLRNYKDMVVQGCGCR